MPWGVAAGRLAAILSLSILVVAGLSACGSSGGSESGPASTPSSTERGGSAGETEEQGSQQGEKPAKHRETAEQELGGFGAEAGTGPRQAVLAAEQAYLTSMANKRYDAACALLSKPVEQSLGQIAEPKLRAKGCVAILPMASTGSTGGAVREQLEGKVTKVRIHGREALVLYRTTVGLFAFPMIREPGGWKAGGLSGTIVAPSAQTLSK